MTYRKTDTLREVIFKTLSQVTPSTKVVDMFKLTEELAEYIERHPDLVDVNEMKHYSAYLAGLKKGYKDCSILGNEFDRMHKVVDSRYVAERIFAITDA